MAIDNVGRKAQISPMAEPFRPAAPAGPIHRRQPDGDTRERMVCLDCGFIDYRNPLVVTGAVVGWSDPADAEAAGRILLCRRSIDPQRGLWTLPAGFLELGESTEDGARREAREEAGAEIAIDCLLALYNIPRISQVQTIYRARLLAPDIVAGEETLEVGLFAWDAIPWREIAFPTVRWALEQYRAVAGVATFAPFGNPPGASADFREGHGA